MYSIEGSFFSRVRSAASTALHPHTLITDRFRRGGSSPRGPSAPAAPMEPVGPSPDGGDPAAAPDQPTAEETPAMMDADPTQLAGFQLGPNTMRALQLRPASSMLGWSFANFARGAMTPPGLAQAVNVARRRRGQQQQHKRRRRHHGQLFNPAERAAMAMRGRPPAMMVGAGFWSNLLSKLKAKRAQHRADQVVALENRCKAIAHNKARHAAAVMGFPWSRIRDAASAANRASKDRYGKLLISAIPYGATALEARDVANRALRTGDLHPKHLAAAGELAARGRAGDEGALTKIAYMKRKAGQGDSAAEKALDTVKLAQVIQTGGRVRDPGAGSHGGRHYRSGIASLMRG
jgi:hypothetical protein